MATAQQIAQRMLNKQVEGIDEQLAELNKTLKKYEPLFDLRRKLEASRRALLSERAPTAGGGRGLTQEEVVNALSELGEATVAQVAEKLSASEPAVRGHFNRGDGERFSSRRDNGVVLWSVRDPENDDEGEDEEEEDE